MLPSRQGALAGEAAERNVDQVTTKWPVPIEIHIDGRRASSVTRFTPVGPYGLVFATALVAREAPVSVTSTYVAQRRTATHATHLTLCPGQEPRIETRMDRLGALPVEEDERRSCLYEHLQQVLSALLSLGYQASIEVLDDAWS